jgi:hypothetical protein
MRHERKTVSATRHSMLALCVLFIALVILHDRKP